MTAIVYRKLPDIPHRQYVKRIVARQWVVWHREKCAVLACGALAVVGFIGPRILSAALQFAGAHPWVLVLVVLALVAWIARQASKDNPSW